MTTTPLKETQKRRASAKKVLDTYTQNGSPSHSQDQLVGALLSSTEVWHINSQGAGHDDILIGTITNALLNLIHYHNLEKIPKGWIFEQIGPLKH